LSGKDAAETPIVVTQAYDLALWLLPKVERLPRSYRFTLGLRMTDAALDLLTLLVEAAYRKNKTATLDAASNKVNLLRYLVRLSKDLKHFPDEGYFHVMTKLDEIGRMVGGWRRERSMQA
jgi:hypothetical protein